MFSILNNIKQSIASTLLALTIVALVFGGFFAGEMVVSNDLPTAYAQETTANPSNAATPGGAVNNSSVQHDAPQEAHREGNFVTTGIMAAAGWIFSAIFGMFLSLQQLILWISAIAFDSAVNHTVVGMGNTLHVANGPQAGQLIPGILIGWTTLRDISNIIFIFALVFIGIATILGLQSYGWRSLMVRLIIAALLINFSLLIAKVVIDTSNLIASEAYAVIMQDAKPGDQISTIITKQSWMISIFEASGPMDQTGISNVLGLTANPPADTYWILAWKSLFLMILLAILTFIFFAATIMLIGRFVILVFLMITSPIAFAAMILPQTRELSKEWWHSLFYQSLFAPAFLLMLWIAMMLMVGLSQVLGVEQHSFAELAGGAQGAVVVFIYFGMVAGLLIASLIMASRMGAYGASAALEMGKRWSRTAGGALTLGAVGALSRNTIGRVSSKRADDENLRERASQKGWRGALARTQLKAYRGAAGASFDARSTSLGKQMGLSGTKGGYQAKLDAQAKQRVEFAKSLGTVDNKDPLVANALTQQAAAEQGVKKLEETRNAESRILANLIDIAQKAGRRPEDDSAVIRQRAKISDIQSNIATATTAVASAKGVVASEKNRRQRGYADTLEHEPTADRLWMTVARKNEVAAKKIRGELEKGTDQKVIDALKEAGIVPPKTDS